MMKRWIMMFGVVGLVAGCASTPTPEQEAAKVEDRKPSVADAKPVTSPKPATAPSDASTRPLTGDTVSRDPLKDPANILSRRSIYFDYDSNVVKDEYKPVIAAHAKYLSTNRSTKMTIQGNTDERGSREYNLALGQRRADAVRQMMTLLGATAGQIETVSFGEEKPKSQGRTDESGMAENRRADIVYPNEY